MDWILRADSLVKRFGDITAVDNISFEIQKGEIFGFLGPNGAGKTTSIKIMSGLLKPDSGSIIINNLDKKGSIGICPQHLVVWENLTCIEQIRFMGQMYDMPAGRIKDKAAELLTALGLDSVKNRLAGYLSGGMQRRLNIALALIHSPELLFLDEPQAGLDPQSRILVREYIRSIKKITTVVLTTHDMEEAGKLSDRICIIDKGKLIALGSHDEITSKTGLDDLVEIEIEGDIQTLLLPFINNELIKGYSVSAGRTTFKSDDPKNLAKRILTIVSDQNIMLHSLQLRKKSLEDIFIDLTGRSLRE
jgi:ABC-2 type transport system ATP-binding protein